MGVSMGVVSANSTITCDCLIFRTCGFVVDCGDSDYQCYGLYAKPNCEQLCLQLHLACQERFERVLEAHPEAKAIQDTLKKENVCLQDCV